VRGGKLDHRCHIQQDSSNDDNPTATWTGDAFVRNWPCSVQPIGGDESYRGRQLEAHVDYVVEGRWVDGVKAEMRLYVASGFHRGKTLNIDNAREFKDRGGRRLELYCTELVS
jgi:head-tail adaptor